MATGQMCTQGSQPGFHDLFHGFHMPQRKQMKPVRLITNCLPSFPGVFGYPSRILRATLQLPEFLTSSHHSPDPRILHTKSQPFSSQNSLTQVPALQFPESFTPNHCPPAPRIFHTKSLLSCSQHPLYQVLPSNSQNPSHPVLPSNSQRPFSQSPCPLCLLEDSSSFFIF